VKANIDPRVLPTKLHNNALLKANAIPAAVSTTDVGRPHVVGLVWFLFVE
jgi:hypothetical protein